MENNINDWFFPAFSYLKKRLIDISRPKCLCEYIIFEKETKNSYNFIERTVDGIFAMNNDDNNENIDVMINLICFEWNLTNQIKLW